jgi:hypothetical protein
VLFITLSGQAPIESTVTRRDAIDSANRRFIENRLGLWLLGAGGALAITGAVLAIVYRRDIFGGGEGGAALSRLDLAPIPGGALATASLRW